MIDVTTDELCVSKKLMALVLIHKIYYAESERHTFQK